MTSINAKTGTDDRGIRGALGRNLTWFTSSGVMKPSDGSWGIAERIIARDNQALSMVISSFPYYTSHPEAYILEHRRPDCNFETAWLFAVAAAALDKPELNLVMENILEYLFNRSGLLNKSYKDLPAGIWEWSSNNLKNQFYFDDNGWNCLIMLMLSNRFPELDRRFQLRDQAMILADTLDRALNEQFFKQSGRMAIVGKPELPHWGSLACMAIATAAGISANARWHDTVARYHRYLETRQDLLNASEQAYLMIGGSIAAKALNDKYIQSVVEKSAAILLSKADPETGNIASEHYEIPNGCHLADLIYTVNWAYMGFQLTAALTGKEIYRQAFQKMTAMLVAIQDRNSNPLFNGCWRGLYDFNTGNWGGGDLHEGGSGSIYTGWTNAPIAICMAHHLTGDSMLDYLLEIRKGE
ncbi:MAG: hypothetical protein WCV67_21590 [Victivallaceae bacterium]